MEEIKKVRISDLIPADYNPRKLSDSSFAMLKKSLEELGQVKPIIVNGANNIIMAGHQRTRAMTALGWTECDAFVLQGVNDQDEARFNQLHNKTEYEVSKNAPTVIIKSELKLGVNEVEPKDIVVKDKGKMAVINKLLSTLIQRYGTFGMPIATPDGVVHISSAYAMASKLCRRKMPVLVMDEERVALAVSYFSKEYGVFCYDTIARKTYIQSLAQMHRLKGTGKRKISSRTYDRLVLPFLDKLGDEGKKLRILDFGAGHYAYADMLRDNGYLVDRVDPYHRYQTGDRRAGNIAVKENAEDFVLIAENIAKYGLYDIVICDSVLNSIDTMQAWNDVVNTCHALLKMDGHLFISGRRDSSIDVQESDVSTSGRLTTYFPDKNNLTAQYRQGSWFFQKFDSDSEIDYIAHRIGTEKARHLENSYRLCVEKKNEIPLDEAIPSLRREWDMLLPNGLRYGLSDIIEKNYREAIKHYEAGKV